MTKPLDLAAFVHDALAPPKMSADRDLDHDIEEIADSFARNEHERGLLKARLLLLVGDTMRYCAAKLAGGKP